MGRRKKITKSDINFFAYLAIFIIAVVAAVIHFVFVGIYSFFSKIWNLIKSFEDSLIGNYGEVVTRKILICALIIFTGCIIILTILISGHIKAVKEQKIREEERKKQEAEEREREQLRKEYQYGYREDMTGYEYEKYCADLFRYFSLTAKATKKSGDFGADVIAEKDGIKIAVQCKKWNGSVGFDAVKEVYTAKAIYKADYAFVITNSYFSQAAKRASGNLGVILIRHPDLEDCLKNLLLYEKSR